MAILDLLASISGEKPSPSTNPAPRPSAILGKRKADDEARPAGVKVARADASRPSSNSPRPSPRPADRVLDRSFGDKQPPRPRPVLDRRTLTEKTSAVDLKARGPGKTSMNGSKPLPSRPSVNRPSPTDSGPPKKRSYAEIMARAKANSEHRESLGKIQHKTVERNVTMKERKELKVEEARKAKIGARKGATGRPGAGSTSLRDVAKTPGARSSFTPSSTNAKNTAPAEPKKIKKAALATTGYTGTARPASTPAKPGATSRPSDAARPRDRPRFGGPLSTSRKRHEDEEDDDDLDDFIVDDEEEEPEKPGYGNPGRYRYDSYEEESDMEAGISDIEGEEQRALRQARREDLEQEAMEKRLKAEKEERRRRFLEKSRGGAR